MSFCESSPDNHTQFQTKMFKIYTRFQTKTTQKPYPLGAAHTYMSCIPYIGEYPHPPGFIVHMKNMEKPLV